jgi:hypothetical protein
MIGPVGNPVVGHDLARIREEHKSKKRKNLRDITCPEFCNDSGKVCSSKFL